MAPRLIAIDGPVKGAIFDLTENQILLGREASNTIHLNDLSVSRRHCIIRRELVEEPQQTVGREQAGNQINTNGPEAVTTQPSTFEFTIVDLESYNRTFVNDVPIHERKLAHGDEIAVGDVRLLFLIDESESGKTLPAPAGESDLITRSTVRLRSEDALYLHPEKAAAELSQSDRVVRDFSVLLKISSSIGAYRSSSELQKYLLQMLRGVFPAERAAIALTERESEQFSSAAGWSALNGTDDSIRPSRAITSQVLRERIALLSNDLFQTEGLADRPSLVEANVCSVLCVPLVVLDKSLGVIYLDTSNRSSRFDENDLQLLTAVAGIAAVAFENAQHVESLQDENQRLQQEINIDHKLVGESESLRDILRFIAKVAPTDSTVLICGESGTGKELAARAIHLNSPRSAKPFIAINCATLTETLIESELFGHEKGAFTGAIALKRGKLELADGGTIFLDEVAELTPLIQAKLLRVLQEREFERVGGTRPIKVDVRLVTATNKDLKASIKANRFREDLYYRLNVVSVVMPPLRERRDDIPLLANYFLSIFSKKCKRKVRGITEQARLLFQQYDWPGNVRELENAIECAVVLGSGDLLTVDDLPERLLEGAVAESSTAEYHQAVADAKKQLIINAVRQASGNISQAAKALGIHPNNLHRLIKTLNIKADIANL
jgi:Nif-specific regulatory protein